MDSRNYVSQRFGRVARQAGARHAFDYFLPQPLPRAMDLEPATVLALSEADAALGLLNGLGTLVTDPEMLIGPFLTREALSSSRIEGTHATLSDVFRAEAVGDPSVRSEGTDEVSAYLRALQVGLTAVESLPLTQRLILDVHRQLLVGTRGEDREPGQLRRSPVWIGSPGDTLDTAQFVPPLPEHLPDLLANWEIFVNDPPPLPALLRAGLMHYQFETIHPFLDGNGRIGRLLIGLLLISERRLSKPLLYLSGYLETHRQEYYEALQGVRERGDVDSYLHFFFTAVRDQAGDAVERARNLIDLREQYTRQCRLDRSLVGALLPLIFRTPFVTVQQVQVDLGVTHQGARNLLHRAASSYGWLTAVGTVGRGGRALWMATDVLRVIDSPLSYPTEVGA